MQGSRKDKPILCCPGGTAPLFPTTVLFGSGCFPYCSHLQVSVRAAASQAVKLPSAFNAAWGHPRSSG